MGIEFKEGAVCFAGGEYLFAPKSTLSVELLDVNLYKINMGDVVNKIDFKLNTIKQGDCIEDSELNTEQKYNDVVEVFKLFGLKPSAAVLNFNSSKSKSLTCVGVELWRGLVTGIEKRKLTYQQIMVIGELKRLELKIEEDKRDNKIVSIADVSAEWARLFENERVKVGDIVSLRYKYDSKQIIHTGKILYLSKRHIMLLKENHDVHLHRCEWIIEKPKTPEELLRERVEKRLKGIIFLTQHHPV
tara:strand:- start:17001 stop:17735 length:735 start_codon:yes stop_codon:yes gene_type:complete